MSDSENEIDNDAEANLVPQSYDLVPTFTLQVISEGSYAIAHSQREDIRTYMEDVAAVYDPQEKDLEEILERTKERRATHEKTAKGRDAELKASMSTYQTAKAAKAQALNQRLIDATRAAQQKVIHDHATQLATNGQPEAALEVLETPLPDTPTPKATAPLTTTLHHWEMVDSALINRDHLQPNHTKISATFREYRHNAPDRIGPGSVRYTPRVNPRRESRKKS